MSFWKGKKVLVTGHTGFKGSWLSLWLQNLGAEVIGYALNPSIEPNLYTAAEIEAGIISYEGDIRDERRLSGVIRHHKPEIVFHLAAQPLVRASYVEPIETFSINVMGTANLLQAARSSESIRVLVNVTTDKCYENKEWPWAYREMDKLGGYDPYSASKACAELVTSAFRQSYFNDLNIYAATVRAGNVIGGGDWSPDRIVPDIVKSLVKSESPRIRNPQAIRPWQHVLEPLRGYMMLAEKMWEEDKSYADAWNFGPNDEHVISVGELTRQILNIWGTEIDWSYERHAHPHEAQILRLDSSKAKFQLGWSPKLLIEETITWTVQWYKEFYAGSKMRQFTLQQIDAYERKIRGQEVNDRVSMPVL